MCRGTWGLKDGETEQEVRKKERQGWSPECECPSRHCEPHPTQVCVSLFNPFSPSPAYPHFPLSSPSLPHSPFLVLSPSLMQHGLTFPEKGGLWWNVCRWLSHGVRRPSLPGGRREREREIERGRMSQRGQGGTYSIGNERLISKGPQVRRETRILSVSQQLSSLAILFSFLRACLSSEMKISAFCSVRTGYLFYFSVPRLPLIRFLLTLVVSAVLEHRPKTNPSITNYMLLMGRINKREV